MSQTTEIRFVLGKTREGYRDLGRPDVIYFDGDDLPSRMNCSTCFRSGFHIHDSLQAPEAGARVDRLGNGASDFEVPGPVGRDVLTEAWHPSDVEMNIRHVLIALCTVSVFGLVFLAGYLAGAGAR